MNKPRVPFVIRHWVVLVILLGAFVALAARAIDLQVNRKAFLQNQGEIRHLRVVRSPAHRGVISDRHGDPLAISTPVVSLWIKPRELANQTARWPELVQALDMKLDALERLVAKRMRKDFVYLRRHVHPQLARDVLDLEVTGVYAQSEYRRYYPHAEVSAHVLGITNIDDQGIEGMELAFDDWLTGRAGAKRVMQDRLGRPIADVESIQITRHGQPLRLALDQRLQYLAYRALKSAVVRNSARSGSVVLVDVPTGEILAMVNQPSFNPNSRTRGRGDERRNRAVTDLLEPGSTMKPFTVAIGLQSGAFDEHSIIDTSPGQLRIGKHTIKDKRNYGRIDLRTLIQKSSNVGSSKIALDLDARTHWAWLSALGFGQPTGSGFPGESGGILTQAEEWGAIRRATLSFGYGLSVTPLQLAQAYVAIARDGVLQRLTFQLRQQAVPGRRILAPDVARNVRGMMEAVVQPGSSGALAAIPGYRVAGKTGTAKKAAATGGYAEGRYVAAFAGMAPASRPRLVCVVVLNDPAGKHYYGGQVAAPVFRSVVSNALRLLGVAPDKPEELGQARLAGG